MQGIVLHCPNPNCQKLLMKDVVLVLGTRFTCKCFYCGIKIKIRSENQKIIIENLDKKTNDKDLFIGI